MPKLCLTGACAALLCLSLPGQNEAADLVIRVTPRALTMQVGDEAQLKVEVVDPGGRPAKADVVFFSRARRSVAVDEKGKVKAIQPGEFAIIARILGEGRRGPSVTVPVKVVQPAPARVEFQGTPAQVFARTTVPVRAAVVDARGGVRGDLAVALASSDDGVATVDAFGQLTGHRPGKVKLTAASGPMRATAEVTVLENPVRAVQLAASRAKVRTGDVVRFTPTLRSGSGEVLQGVPVHLSLTARPADALGQGATGQIEQDGRFVAETPGLYTVVATCGDAVARETIEVVPRNVQQRLELVGHGEVFDVHTSDLWVWEGKDGRDYAVTGTWGADGEAYFWDVTDPKKMERIATVKVDARTVNDVKVSEDGRICVLSREGASDRKNGIIIVDVSNPRSPRMLATFTHMLTGGVHNLYIDKGYVYALSAARRYDVIDIRDPGAPRRVSSFELKTPGHSIHDVWVEKGIAYSSNWRDGVQLVDVGNGIKGGSPENPVKIASYAYPSGWNHAAFPFRSVSTGRFYVIAGDEAFPYGLSVTDRPTYPRGWFHFIDFSDLEKPKEVARYEVPEAGTHNLWVEGDVLYGAYYNGGLRVVDISGELMGDLYRQGREIAWFLPTHHKGKIPNASMVWGPQPYKGNIFFSDWNSGLWCVRLAPEQRRRR